jgi:hypothetical protein
MPYRHSSVCRFLYFAYYSTKYIIVKGIFPLKRVFFGKKAKKRARAGEGLAGENP